MIELKNINKTYFLGKSNEHKVLNNIDLKISDGELVAIIGKSGAGKTTLLNIIACIDNFESGIYKLDEKEVEHCNDSIACEIRNKIGVVMQDFALIDEFSGFENVILPLDFSPKIVSGKKQKVMNALKSVGMDMIAEQKVSQLSGGQKQRIAIARAIVNEPSIILADEPTGALDTVTSSEIISLLFDLNQKGITLIIVTHDMKIAEQCNRIIEISDGKILSDRTKA
ncbi:ABC transporter ATP-binding protein [Ruminococcus sp. HUN007]|uniref:ABC transporter ATP-binding protein n=1 Tax=Ruminococcus sp. HUN007 TaxID=1514668 RepID=UPI0005D1490C|nr:ABC transporter ATP-binding protein [Ruminococcus sp. HUN007]